MSEHGETILIVDNDSQTRDFIANAVNEEGYSSRTAAGGNMAIKLLVSEKIDLLLLDMVLPDIDALEVINRVREWSEIPIIVMSERDKDHDKAIALDLGADDYLTKPFNEAELLARIRVALMHICQPRMESLQPVYQVGALRLEADRHMVFLDERELSLTPLEYSLLLFMFKNQGKIMTSVAIIREIYGTGYGADTRELCMLISGLVRKIERNPEKPRYILMEAGVGYRLADEWG